MGWKLHYASHLGYLSPDAPLFRHSAGSADPVANVDFAADLGFAGVQDVWIAGRPIEEQRRIGAAMERHGLEGGCVGFTARERIRDPLWTTPGVAARDDLLREVGRTSEAAKRINARLLVIITGALPGVPHGYQMATLVEHMRWAAEAAGRDGMVLCLEAINGHVIPNMLLNHIADVYLAVKAVDHPACKLIFDTGHIQGMEGDILGNLEKVRDEIALFQIADNPRRLEPGSGDLNFANILKVLAAGGYRGLVEWEHGWSQPTRECEQRGIDYVRQLDARLEVAG